MKYILGFMLLGFLAVLIHTIKRERDYLEWYKKKDQMPDIEDVETCHVEPEKPWPRSNLTKSEINKYIKGK